MKKKMVLKKVLGMVCMTLVVAVMLFATQKAGKAMAGMRSPGGFISFTVLK